MTLRDTNTVCKLGLRHVETPEFPVPTNDGTEVDLQERTPPHVTPGVVETARLIPASA